MGRYQKKILVYLNKSKVLSLDDFLSIGFSKKKIKKVLNKMVKENVISKYRNYNIFYKQFYPELIIRKIDPNSYLTEYSAISFYEMTTDGVCFLLSNSNKESFNDLQWNIGFNKTTINKEDYNEIQLLDWTSIKVATPERAFFDFLLTHKDFIVKDWNLEQFGEDSYRFEWIGAVNQNKILEYCRETWDEDMIYLGEFFWKFIEWYRESKDFSDGFEPYKEYPKMKNLKYF